MLLQRIAVKTAFFINGFVFANWVSRLPRIQELYDADDGTIGLVLLASSVGAVGAMPFTGWVIIKNGSRSITLISALLYCALVPIIPLAHDLLLLIVLYFFIGIVTGMLDVAMNAQAILVERNYNKPIMTSFHALFSIGMMVGATSASVFTDAGFDLTSHFFIVGGSGLLAAVWMRRHLVHDSPDATHHDGPLFRLPNKSMVALGIITFCCMIGEGSMSDWSVNYMENIANSSVTIAPFGLSAFATAMTLGRIFGDSMRNRFGDRSLIVGGGLLALVGLSCALIFPLPYVTIVGFFLVGLGLSTIVPIAYSISGNEKNLPAGVGLAMVTTVGYAGFLLGPPLIGFIADWQDLRFSLGVIALLILLMTILGYRYKATSSVR